MPNAPRTVAEYLSALPPERRKELAAVRKVLRDNLTKGFKETLDWGMITYELPLSAYPDTHNGKPLMLAALASQKSHLALYLMCSYMDEESDRLIRDAYRKAGLKPDRGKSCLRFKKAEQVPLEAIGKVVRSFTAKRLIEAYERGRRT